MIFFNNIIRSLVCLYNLRNSYYIVEIDKSILVLDFTILDPRMKSMTMCVCDLTSQYFTTDVSKCFGASF
jgi:hypothetical protein